MKKLQAVLFVFGIIAVFVLSFLIGRVSALRDKSDISDSTQIYTGTIPLPDSFKKEIKENKPASIQAEGVERQDADSDDEKKNEEEQNEFPTRMLFPCGTTVLKPYSETAVYSETMDDWRAHTGIDYAAKKGTDVTAIWDGQVTAVYKDRIWGNTVEISHAGTLKSVYRNLSEKIPVTEGQAVFTGQIIGYVGKTATVESHEPAHLHFELWQDGMTINPVSYIY